MVCEYMSPFSEFTLRRRPESTLERSDAPETYSKSAMRRQVAMESAYRARSISMPARLHPHSQSFDDELSKLKAWAAPLLQQPSPPLNAEVMTAGLAIIASFYDSLDNFLAHGQQGIRGLRGDKRVADFLDSSVRMLDVFSAARESLVLIREHAEDVQSALRRRCAGPAIDAYVRARAKARKDAAGCLRVLKQMDDGGHGCTCSPAVDQGIASSSSMVIKVLLEARTICISFLQALLSSLSCQSCEESLKFSKWIMVSRAMLRGKQPHQRGMEELERVDDLVASFHRRITTNKVVDASMAEMVQKQMDVLEVQFVRLEDALERTFRRLIQNRVSLLNILSC